MVALNILNYDVCHILIDNESSTDILFYDIFLKMRIPIDQLEKIDSPVVGFIGDEVITLTMKTGRFPLQSTIQVDF